MYISGQGCVSEFVFLVLQETLHISFIHLLVVWNCRHWRSGHCLIIDLLIFIFLNAHSWMLGRLSNIWAYFCLISWSLLNPKRLVLRMTSLERLVHIDRTTDQTFLRLRESNRCASESLFFCWWANSLRASRNTSVLFTWISTIWVSHWLTRSFMNVLQSKLPWWKLHLRVSSLWNARVLRAQYWRYIPAIVENSFHLRNTELIRASRRISMLGVVEPDIMLLFELLVLPLMSEELFKFNGWFRWHNSVKHFLILFLKLPVGHVPLLLLYVRHIKGRSWIVSARSDQVIARSMEHFRQPPGVTLALLLFVRAVSVNDLFNFVE